jgi:hypothetical protein
MELVIAWDLVSRRTSRAQGDLQQANIYEEEAKGCDEYCATAARFHGSMYAAIGIAAQVIAKLDERRELPRDILEQYKRDFEVSFAYFIPPLADGPPFSAIDDELVSPSACYQSICTC